MKPQMQTAPKEMFEAAFRSAQSNTGPHLRGGGGPSLLQASQLETWNKLNIITAPPPPPSQTNAAPPPPSTSARPASDTVLEMSPRGKHSYPRAMPWNCDRIASWGGLIIACVALVLVCIVYFPGRDHRHTDTDIERRIERSDQSLSPLSPQESPHENYVAFRYEAETGPTRWPKTGVIAGLVLADIVSTRLCCVVGSQQYLVCDSSQGLTSNLGISYIVRNLAEEHGAHLLITAPSSDMTGSQCIFSWQTRIREHDKGSLVVAKGEPAKAVAAKSWFAHDHRGKRGP